MKAQYLIPATEIIEVKMDNILVTISSVSGMQDGGQAGGGVKPQMPGRPIYF